jgi:integrase
VQLLVGVDGLGCIKQVFHELAAQIHIHLLKGAFAVHEPLEMLVYVLPLDILAVSQSFEIGKEIALHLGLVKKAVVFIENGFVALVAQEVLKKAFLFACLTGLRKSDIRQLTWQQIQPYTNGRMFVTTRMQKTKEIVHNPISDEAYGLLGERGEGLIFEDFKDKMLQGPLQRWLTAAGITKKITFHCTRHSFGSLHVEMGTDMAVIQAYLGHKNITTTQIYSKIAAQQMCQVVDKITLKRKEA